MLKKCFNFFRDTCLNGVYFFIKTNIRVKQWLKNYFNISLPQEVMTLSISVKYDIFQILGLYDQKRIQLASIKYAFFKSTIVCLSNDTSFTMATRRRKLLLGLENGKKHQKCIILWPSVTLRQQLATNFSLILQSSTLLHSTYKNNLVANCLRKELWVIIISMS